MQSLDLRHDVAGQRHSRLAKHPALRLARVHRAAVEAEPGFRLEELAVAVDEVRHPERSVKEIDRNLPTRGKPQQLSLDPHAFSVGYQHVLLHFGANVRPRLYWSLVKTIKNR